MTRLPSHGFAVICAVAFFIPLTGSAAMEKPVEPTARGAVRAWQREVALDPATHKKVDLDGSFPEQLSYRVGVDQAMRHAISNKIFETLPDSERSRAEAMIWKRIRASDFQNVSFLERKLPKDGWFRYSRDGEEVARNAWVIVQHSPDASFQEFVLAKIKPLVLVHEASGEDYALLYDRLQVTAGRPQLFGSQIACIEHKFCTGVITDPEHLDQRRKLWAEAL